MIFQSVLIAGMLFSPMHPRIATGSQPIGELGLARLGALDSFALVIDSPSSKSTADKPNADNEQPASHPPPHITIVDPAPPPARWDVKDRIAWAANVILAILGYVGIMLVVSLLRKIERQTRYVEEAVVAATKASEAALQHTQALVRSERPWVMITVEPSPTLANSSVIVATNRGKSPAKLVAAADRIVSAVDQDHLPAGPEYENGHPSPLADPLILLPGESAEIRIFGPDDVKGFCGSEERLKRVEEWQERLFVYGTVVYRDLISPDDDKQLHESSWCCWYVAGKRTSGLVAVSIASFKRQT